jgi:uncharacterized RDD family membrane protein YckC
VTAPQDPFSTPPSQPQGFGQPPAPGYGQPPADYGAPTPQLASWGLRVAATLIDTVIAIVVQLVFAAISQSLAQLAGLVVFLVFAYLLGTTGQTPGKRLIGIKIVKEADGTYIGFGMAIVRAIAHILDALPLLVGYLWPLWDAKRQTFADKVIGTLAVKA